MVHIKNAAHHHIAAVTHVDATLKRIEFYTTGALTFAYIANLSQTQKWTRTTSNMRRPLSVSLALSLSLSTRTLFAPFNPVSLSCFSVLFHFFRRDFYFSFRVFADADVLVLGNRSHIYGNRWACVVSRNDWLTTIQQPRRKINALTKIHLVSLKRENEVMWGCSWVGVRSTKVTMHSKTPVIIISTNTKYHFSYTILLAVTFVCVISCEINLKHVHLASKRVADAFGPSNGDGILKVMKMIFGIFGFHVTKIKNYTFNSK